MKSESVKSLCIAAMCTAILCLISPISIPIGAVPISLATFAIYLTSSILRPKYAVLSVLAYILLGMVGVPVFAGWTAGVQVIAGVTGGYIVGYLILALTVSLFTSKFDVKWMLPVSMLMGTVLLYVIGTVWYIIETKNPVISALTTCVVPFIPGDIAKIVGTTLLALPVRKGVGKVLIQRK